MNFAKCISLFGISLACMFNPLSAQEPSVTDAKSAQLAELEKEKSYQMIREYIDYAKENDLHIPMSQVIKDYLRREYNKELGIVLYYGKNGISSEAELDAVWAIYNSYALEMKKLYLALPGAAELEKEYKAKHISREDYIDKRGEYMRIMMTGNPDVLDVGRKHNIAHLVAMQSTLSLILDDYIRQDITVPTDWIPESLQKRFAKSKRVKDVQKKIDALNN